MIDYLHILAVLLSILLYVIQRLDKAQPKSAVSVTAESAMVSKKKKQPAAKVKVAKVKWEAPDIPQRRAQIKP